MAKQRLQLHSDGVVFALCILVTSASVCPNGDQEAPWACLGQESTCVSRIQVEPFYWWRFVCLLVHTTRRLI